MMDHTTFSYLMAPGIGFLEFYRSEATPEAIADSVACFAAAAE
jgi:protein SCO1/2